MTALAIRSNETDLAPAARLRKPKRTAFAAQTKVTVFASQRELREMLTRAGATHIETCHDESACVARVSFVLHNAFTFAVVLPARPDLDAFLASGEPLEDWPGETYSYGTRCRERWRAIVLWTRGALEMVRLRTLTARATSGAEPRRLGR